MRILKLRFQNLNSLVGEWEIDFTHPAYADEGIFAITGATGAGKSTILDAICLALYGQTPRLEAITQSKNDLMSRQTGECASEVIFSTKNGNYRCTWMQSRARKKPDGKLKSPTHEIAIFTDESEQHPPLETQTKKTKKLVEEFTGMDFKRFTQSMLLAQGSFAAFLQADEDERSNLLEQITGTEIYGIISKKVHELDRSATAELNSLKDQLSGMQLLSRDEEQALIEQKNLLQNSATQIATTIDTLTQDKAWREKLDNCQNQLAKLSQQKVELDHRTEQFKPHQSRLQRAFKALEIKSDIEQLRSLRQQLSSLNAQLSDYQQQLPNATIARDNAKLSLDNSLNNLTTAEEKLKQEQPRFKTIREIDSQRHQQIQLQQQSQNQLAHLREQLTNNQQAFDHQQQQLIQIQNEQQVCLSQQQQLSHPDKLPEHLATLQQLQENLRTLANQNTLLVQEQTAITNNNAQTEQALHHLSQQIEQTNQQLSEKKSEQQTLEQTLTELSQGLPISERYNQLENFLHAQNRVTSTRQTLQQWHYNVSQNQLHHSELGEIAQKIDNIEQTLQSTMRDYHDTESALELLQNKKNLLTEIQNLTQLRNELQLKSGDPCPLCGATEHPYITHLPDENISQTEQQIAQSKQQLKLFNQQLQQFTIDKNNAQNRQQFLQQQLIQLSEHNQQLIEQLTDDFKTLPNMATLSTLLDSSFNNLLKSFDKKVIDIEIINQQFLQLAQQLEYYEQSLSQQSYTLKSQIEQYERQRNAYQTLQTQITQLKEHQSQQSNQQTKLQIEQQSRIARLAQLEQSLTENLKEKNLLQNRIDALFMPFITVNNQAMFAQELSFKQRFEALQQLYQQSQQLSQRLQVLSENLTQVKQTLISLDSEKQHLSQHFLQVQQNQQGIQEKLQQLIQERQKQFGDKDVDTEERLLSQARTHAFEIWRKSEQAYQQASQQQQAIQQHIETLDANIAQLQSNQHNAASHVAERLATRGFADETDYQSAVLPDSEREQLQREANNLIKDQQSHDSLFSQATQQQTQLLDTPRTNLSLGQLTILLNEKQQQHSDYQKQLGGVERTLSNNHERKADQSQLLEQIEEKSIHAKEWKDLHELIGSNDGKKFRNFAQGLTFNIMITHANEQLEKMSNRYLLLADEKEPLMLNVMDNYQGGEIRTSKNLSGGESFIISLSLALGLSNMASHRMQVDSLFLDEGFGTLDEEALDVALDTLTNLQQSGKLIGVISHIQALKDRIASQIQVIPQTGGVSKIVGAGITKLS